MERVLGIGSLEIRVFIRVRSPVQGTLHFVVPTERIGMVVTPRFHDVDLSRRWPSSVSVYDRKHPDGWPEPVSLGDFGNNFNSTVLDTCTNLGVDAP
jgi:hypothetical protein